MIYSSHNDFNWGDSFLFNFEGKGERQKRAQEAEEEELEFELDIEYQLELEIQLQKELQIELENQFELELELENELELDEDEYEDEEEEDQGEEEQGNQGKELENHFQLEEGKELENNPQPGEGGEGKDLENQLELEKEKKKEKKEKRRLAELTVLDYLREQRKIRDLLNPISLGEKEKKEKGRSKSELWIRCDDCGAVLYLTHVRNNDDLCMGCGHHLKMSSLDRLDLVIDQGSWRPLFDQFSSCDPLEFEDYGVYAERTVRSQESTELLDAIQTGTAFVDSVPIALAVMDFGYMGGSMGSVVGEKLTRLIEYATTKGLCLLVICASGGARMQEGSLSLMQMAKISAALYNYQKRANLAYINILTSPTTGGVTASFGMLADFIVTEPKSIIGFAGRRVIEATIGEILPPNFQTAEYLIERGHVDIKVKRKFVREVLSNLIWATNRGNYKTAGFMERGLHNGLTHFKEERARRVWKGGNEKSLRDLNSYYPNLTDKKLYASFNKRLAELKAKGVTFEKPLIDEEIDPKQSDTTEFNNPNSEEKTKTSSLYSGKNIPYTNSELLKFLENPRSFLTNLENKNNGEEFFVRRKKKLEKFSNSQDYKREPVFIEMIPFFLLDDRKKLHGIARIERIERNKNIIFNRLNFKKLGNNCKWIPLKKIRGNYDTDPLTHVTATHTYITGISNTGIYTTWTPSFHTWKNRTGKGKKGTADNEKDNESTENKIGKKEKIQGPLIKLKTVLPFSKSKVAVKTKVNSYIQALKRLFLTRASNASYLQVLGTFEAVAHLFNSSTAKREEKKCKPVSFAFNYERDSLVTKFSILDEAIAFAKAQSFHWRNVYDGECAPQKLAPFQSFFTRQREKRFFYYILEKHLNLLEKRRANRLANPQNAANERLTKKNAGANVTKRADSVEMEIEKNFQEFLKQKYKKHLKKKEKS